MTVPQDGALMEHDGVLQLEREALGEARSQLELMDTALAKAQARAERKHMSLEDV
jgi:hypothetical protein